MIRLSIVSLAAAIAATAIAVTPAPAQLISPFGKNATTGLSKEDLALMRKAMRDALEQKRVGATNSWVSKTSGRAGKATVTRVFEQNGMSCAQLTHEFTSGPGTDYVAPLCKTKDGTWKIAF